MSITKSLVSAEEIVRRLCEVYSLEKLTEDTKDGCYGIIAARDMFELNAKMQERVESLLFREAFAAQSEQFYAPRSFETELPTVEFVRQFLGRDAAESFRLDLEAAECEGISLNTRENWGLVNRTRIRKVLRTFSDFLYSDNK